MGLAAARGLPCLTLTAPDSRDSVVDNCTGRFLDSDGQLPDALVRALSELAFSWERSTALLASARAHARCDGRGDGRIHVLLSGCDESDAVELLAHHGIDDAALQPAGRQDLLAGLGALPSVRLNSTAHLDQAGMVRETP